MKTDKTTERMNAIVAPIIEAIENGIANPADWTAPWHRVDAAAFAAFNPVTGRSYTGGNRFVLAVETMVNGAESHWGTYRHWASLSKHTKACEVAATNVGKRNESRPECGDDYEIDAVVEYLDTQISAGTTKALTWREVLDLQAVLELLGQPEAARGLTPDNWHVRYRQWQRARNPQRPHVERPDRPFAGP